MAMNVRKEKVEKILAKEIINKGDLDKTFMTAFVVVNGSDDDKVWFAELLQNNLVRRSNNVRGGVYTSIDLTVVREKFCRRFDEFYQFSDKAKREKAREVARENDIFANFLDDFGISLVA